MKLIRIKAKQSMVNYKRPMSYISGETYPLPPFSTVIGMIHTACGFTEYHPMKISIQGEPKSVVSDMQIKYAGGTATFEEGRHTEFTMSEGKKIGYTKGPGNVELITDIDLIIHVLPEKECELETIKEGMLNPQKFLALGRHEDILNIKEVKIVEVKLVEEAYTTHNIYFQKDESNKEFESPIYKLKKVFKIDPKTNLRSFDEPIKMYYLSKGEPVYDVLIDDEENVICLV